MAVVIAVVVVVVLELVVLVAAVISLVLRRKGVGGLINVSPVMFQNVHEVIMLLTEQSRYKNNWYSAIMLARLTL